MKTVAFLAAALLLIGCSKQQQSGSSSGSIEGAAAEYSRSLADGTLDGYLNHDQPFQTSLLLAKSSVPTDLWSAREAEMRTAQKNQIQQSLNQLYGPTAGACYLIIRSGAQVKTKEVRQANTGMWQVFYDVSYADDHSSPAISLPSGKVRFFHSGTFSVQFQQVAAGQNSASSTQIVAQPNCALVDGTLIAWPVSALTSDQATTIAQQAGVFPTRLTIQIQKTVFIPQGQNWDDYLNSARIIQQTLEKHGWSVTVVNASYQYYYDMKEQIEPPSSAQQWVVGPVTNGYVGQGEGYVVVFLDNAQNTVASFDAQEDTATAVFSTHYAECTAFCELWKDFRSLPPDLGKAVFYGAFGLYNPSFDLDASYPTTIQYAWDTGNGWHVQH